jgi:dTDP-4-amino-4,6-dideoxygalactose transaminase
VKEGRGTFRVPRSRVAQTHRGMREEVLAALEPLLFERVSEGHSVRAAFEEAFAAAVGHPYACAVHSGTVALFLALRACGVRAGDEVITVGNSDVSTTAAISHCGATSVLCDVREDDYTIDVDLVEELVTSRTRAIMPVDLYGHPSDVRRLRELADRHGLRIVEDAALATGAADYGVGVGAFADATIFSFAPYKPLGSVGNGAVIASHDPAVARRVGLLVGYGHDSGPAAVPVGHQSHVEEGYNVPLDPLQAALLSVKLPYLSDWTARRRAVADAYRRGLEGCAVGLPTFRAESAPTFRSFTVLVDDRQRVYEGLVRAGVEVVLHYTPPVYRQPVYPHGLPHSDRLPVTDRLSQRLVCLPVTVELDDDDVAYACSVLRELVGSPHAA